MASEAHCKTTSTEAYNNSKTWNFAHTTTKPCRFQPSHSHHIRLKSNVKNWSFGLMTNSSVANQWTGSGNFWGPSVLVSCLDIKYVWHVPTYAQPSHCIRSSCCCPEMRPCMRPLQNMWYFSSAQNSSKLRFAVLYSKYAWRVTPGMVSKRTTSSHEIAGLQHITLQSLDYICFVVFSMMCPNFLLHPHLHHWMASFAPWRGMFWSTIAGYKWVVQHKTPQN